MKIQHLILSLILVVPSLSVGQPQVLADAWRDPGFVERFTKTFLPLTQQEPQITEKEAELFQELADLLGNNQSDAALQQLEQAVRTAQDPSTISAALNYTLANLYLQKGRYEDAVREYQTAINKFPDFRRAIKNLGLAQIQAGQFELAIDSLVKSVELGDASGDTFGLLAFSYLNEGNPTAALEGYRQASLLNPGNQEWRIGKAEALMRTERFEEAIAVFKQLIKEMPERNAFYTSIANAYLSLNDAEMASRYLEILRRRGEAKAPALGLLGDIYINESLAGLATSVYSDAVNTGNFSTEKGMRALRALLRRGFYEEAEQFFPVVELAYADAFSEEESREILNLKAQLALAQGQNEEAAEILEEVLQEDPLNGNALILLGGYNQRKEDFETAVYYFERALALPDFQREAQLQLARIYVRQKEYLQAIRQLEAALELQYSPNVQDFLDAVRAVYNRSL